jgi:uncharacterized iron-regulated protein
MQYRQELKKRIAELELEIANKTDNKELLQKQLQDLMKKEFEEELRESPDQQILLKG